MKCDYIYLRKSRMDAELETEIIKKNKDYSNEIKNIDKQIIDLDNQLTRICDFLEKGVYTIELFEQRSKSLTEKKKSLNDLKNALIEENKKDETEIIKKRIPILELCVNNYFDLSIPDRNELLSALITRIEYTKEVSDRTKLDNFTLKIYL